MSISRFKIRLFAFISSIILTFSIVSTDYFEVHALEWVGVAVGYDTALKFLLGLLGVSVGVGVAEEIDWTSLRQDCFDMQIEKGNSQVEVSRWWNDVIHGSLDIASSCWLSFKDWVSSISSSTIGSSFYVVSSAISSIYPSFSFGTMPLEYRDFSFDCAYSYSNAYGTFFYFYSNAIFTINDNNLSISSKDGINKVKYLSSVLFVNNLYSSSDGFLEVNSSSTRLRSGYRVLGYDGVLPNGILSWDAPIQNDSYGLDSVYPDIQDISVINENAINIEVTDTIPLPWDKIGVSDEAIENIIDNAIDRVIDGVMSLSEYWEYIQNITNTYAYSITNNYILPNNGDDETIQDKTQENAENSAFILYGLERVFPFCIPFDIYAFLTLLRAEPVAPVIDFPIYNPITGENETISLDFSAWESVVVLFRYIFDFLLIIGLLLLARPLVGAGGDS